MLFKGMPVGIAGAMNYDPATNKILVRINIKKARDIPANIQPYVESSLMGQSSIALLTETTGPISQSACRCRQPASGKESCNSLTASTACG